MCGIAGTFTTQKYGIQSSHNLVERVVADQYQRGPDYQNIVSFQENNSNIVLGHNRLSIIDLSTHANQPMSDPSHRYWLSYNGEIFNYLEIRAELQQLGYTFTTSSDTEVLLAAFITWGVAAIDRFNGMFAFAIFDKQQQELWLVRDRFGIKPLYYYLDPHRLYFASSTRVLAQELNATPNLDYMARGIRYGIYEDNSDITQYREIKALNSGYYLKLKINSNNILNSKLAKYYDLSARATTLRQELATHSITALQERVLATLTEAVTIRLRADVPVGISLSGGLDSSTIAAFAAERSADLTGFTFGSPSDRTTEAALVAKLATQLKLKVTYVWPEKTKLVAAFWDSLMAQDAPFPSLSIVAQNLVYKATRENGVKVLLGGQGGDESFMGYRKFFYFYLRELLAKRQYGTACGFFCTIVPMLWQELSNFSLYWSQRRRFSSGRETQLQLPQPQLTLGVTTNQSLLQRQVADILQYSLPTLLRYEDRNSMGSSIESRLPFMDYKLIELGLALPPKLKLAHGYGKYIIRQLIKDKIPNSICLARYKRGFDVNATKFISAGLGDSIRERLNSETNNLKDLLPANSNINELYSDPNLANRNSLSFVEAVSLLWLAAK